ncbi:MAG: glycosyltransferase family 2 protein [Chloroflexi bacterium AL-W]|nr:glycosyltransferase family 2 protein [Chloroflexi bacterium AL-N1]NOK68574.1 glycosyltransferase family 2 protein [Chloroflexi bacterium AL-N10]NOK76060.1 glycosyltransferase family 2 protein [Chloroflexi bacterium AL-N5]NOK82533.1 glycosyltransferase family 2 protein [Chloroflexi bacterium AL-W]NOK92843.1 glycosyltransferase family 2 protein [Chloroflexi bacterium AL-N15]
MSPHVLIIVLCYNGIDLTLACLASLRDIEYENYDILIVDNASQDGTPTKVREQYPHVHMIETGANLGFAAGNNIGLRYALHHRYDYALLLNNDTEVAPDFLRVLIDSAESDASIGVVGPTICYHEQPDIVWSAGGVIDWQRGNSHMIGLGERLAALPNQPRDVNFVTGCALLCKRRVLEQSGLLDERFFMYYEESEWCVRAARAGFRIVHIPQAHILHKIPLDARADQPYVAYYMTRNRLLFLRATSARLSAWLHALILQDGRTLLSLSLRPKWRAKKHHRNAMLHAWNDFWHGRFGALRHG